MNFDWIIQELQIQSSVCEMTGDERKVRDLAKAIAMLKKQNGYRLPKIMNFQSIYHPPKHPPPPPNTALGYQAGYSSNIPLNIGPNSILGIGIPTAPAPIHHTISSGTSSVATGMSSVTTGITTGTWATGVAAYPPAPTPAAINPGYFYDYNNPNVGDEIFGMFRTEDGENKCCIYTWQKENNPEELILYAVGWDPVNVIDGTQRWMPCKKHTHEKLLVVCLNECCQQNI